MTMHPLDSLAAAGVIAVVRAPDQDSALRGVEALVDGGITGIEMTYTTPDATEAIAAVRQRFGDEIYLGAGTVVHAAQAREAADAGAAFLVSPGTDPDLTATMLATGCTTLTGALTPSEVMAAVRVGVHAVKIFPATLGGPAYLTALRGPFPDTAFMPTGGVGVDNLAAWFDAGAVAVGAGGDLVSAAYLAAGRFSDLRGRAAAFRSALEAARASSCAGGAIRS